jgi:hypothetical protein
VVAVDSKNNVLEICNGTKNQCKKWFKEKNDSWLLLPIKMLNQRKYLLILL